MKKDHIYYLQRAIEVSRESRLYGNIPFRAILVDGDGNILLTQTNSEFTEHKCMCYAKTMLSEEAVAAIYKGYWK